MPIDRLALAELASRFTGPMTSIRGRRMHRLLMREFAAFDWVLPAWSATGRAAVLGLGGAEAALCMSDGRGPAAPLLRWQLQPLRLQVHHFDLLKDSLPALGAAEPLTATAAAAWRAVLAEPLPPPAVRALAAKALAALG